MKSTFRFVQIVVPILTLWLAPIEASHAALLGNAAKAAAKRLGVIEMRASGVALPAAATGGKPRDVIVHRTRHPEAAAHIEHAQKNGQPTVLTLDRAHATERRHESLRHIERRPGRSLAGNDRDEYPPAMTREGGFNSNVRYIDARDNRGAGKSIERQVRDVPDGGRIRMLVSE